MQLLFKSKQQNTKFAYHVAEKQKGTGIIVQFGFKDYRQVSDQVPSSFKGF